MGARKRGIRKELYKLQDGTCQLCLGKIEMDPTRLNKRTGEPMKTQDRLTGYWIMRLFPRREGGTYNIKNLMLVHPKCGSSYREWIFSKDGESYLKVSEMLVQLFQTKGFALTNENGGIIQPTS